MLRVHAVQDLCFRGRTTDARAHRDVRGLVLEWVACLGFCRDRDVKLRRECRRRGPWSTRTRRRGHRATPAAESDACRQRGGESRQQHASTRQQPAGSCPQAAAARSTRSRRERRTQSTGSRAAHPCASCSRQSRSHCHRRRRRLRQKARLPRTASRPPA